ncbi:NAD(P)-dependent oxidoreductase [Glaciihabitans sp. UYNi722]|uniref:NAD(P)-dependent oxidoreductase n=1 Tax=Glaciihabitans sp. UYNi722 TaxID=3156344 RepID=UPI0033940C42
MTITVALPDATTLKRLSPAPEGVDFVVWTTDEPPLEAPIDLLLLPYSVSSDALPKLADSTVSVVQSQALGFNGVADALPPGIAYCNAVGVHEGPTAELAVALILSAQRGLDVMARTQPSGRWQRDWYPGLVGCSVLIIGVGGVGGAIARRLAPFEASITRAARTARTDEAGDIHSMDDLPELLAAADIVVIGVPLTAETTHLVDAEFLDLMRPGALLVNVSRGPIVDTEALTDRVRTGAVRAALDVVDPEPLPADHPLWTLPGSTLTPHIGGNVSSMPTRIDPIVREQISRLRNGLSPLNIVVDTRTAQ